MSDNTLTADVMARMVAQEVHARNGGSLQRWHDIIGCVHVLYPFKGSDCTHKPNWTVLPGGMVRERKAINAVLADIQSFYPLVK